MTVREIALAKARLRAELNLREFAAHVDAHEAAGLDFRTCPFCMPPKTEEPT